MNALSICIMLVIYGRMIEVYLTTSVGPIPLATMTNRDWSHTGQNYLKSLFALAFQAFLIMVCVGIYSVLVQSLSLIHILPLLCRGRKRQSCSERMRWNRKQK